MATNHPVDVETPVVRPASGMTPRNILVVGGIVFIVCVLALAIMMQHRVDQRDAQKSIGPKAVAGEAPSPAELEKIANEQRGKAKEELKLKEQSETPSVRELASDSASLNDYAASANSPQSKALIQGNTSKGNFLMPPRAADFAAGQGSQGNGSGGALVKQQGEPSVSSPILIASGKGGGGGLSQTLKSAAERAGLPADVANIAGGAGGLGPASGTAGIPDISGMMAQFAPPPKPATALEQNNIFLREARQTKTNQAALRAVQPETKTLLMEGAVLQAVTESSINSDLPGQIRAKVTQDVYDSIQGDQLVIPKGTRLIGTYNANVANAQSRILMVFNRMIFADGRSVDLQGMAGGDPTGRAGATGDINHHFLSNFGSGFLIAGLSYLLSKHDPAATVTVNNNSGQSTGAPISLASTTGQILLDTSKSVADTYKQPRPTIVIEGGTLFSILVQRDMALETLKNSLHLHKRTVLGSFSADVNR